MVQMKTWTWTNETPAVALNRELGFKVARIITTDNTNGGQRSWNSQMDDASYVTVDTGAITSSNGFTPLDQSFRIGPVISGFSLASPGVMNVDSTSEFGFAAGDTVNVVNLADDQAGTSTLNGSFVVASVTNTTITTTTNTTCLGVWWNSDTCN